MDMGLMKIQIDDAYARERGKRRVGRPYKTDEEKEQHKKEYNAKYWAEHKKQISEKRKKRYEEDAEYREHIISKNKEWIENNRDRWNEYMRERRAKLKAIDEMENV